MPDQPPSTIDERLFALARAGDADSLRALLDAHPDRLLAREEPYEWTLLHAAAQKGRLPVVELLLARGLDPNTRERGDESYAMHWAAAGGHLDVVRRLADAGGDVVGRGDDHELEVIGWATTWDGCDDVYHRAVADFLISRGARHHIFSAIALDLGDEVRRIVAADPSAINRRMSRNENHQTALHFAAGKNRRTIVELLLELGADPLAVDGSGQPVAAYAATIDIDRPVMEAIHRFTLAEIASADRGHRAARGSVLDIVATLSLGDRETAERLVRDDAELLRRSGALHLLAKRNDSAAVRWLLDHGADPNARWMHWDAEVTPLHLTAYGDARDCARLLLAAGADVRIRDSKYGGDANGWAEHFGRTELQRLFRITAATE
jgi:ankyrin repeat protein